MNKLTNYFVLCSIALLLFATGFRLGQKKGNVSYPSSQESSLIKGDFSLFWDTWQELQQNYVDKTKINQQKMIYGAIKGMVASVDDPYTFFLTPEENKQSKDDLGGTFEGIGAQLGQKDSKIVVIAPLKDSPAQKAGLTTGDIIEEVNGKSTDKWTLLQAVSAIRGPRGTIVRIKVLRNGKEIEVKIKRDQITVASVELTYEQGIANIKLTKFGDDTNEIWNQKIDEIAKKWNAKQIKGMILDMRDNPGGYLQGAAYIGSEFVSEGKLIVKQESTMEGTKEYLSDGHGRLLDIPIVVLINGGSASAAEIVSGALRDYKRALLVGEKSFGKGSVQEAVDLKGGAGLHVTVAKWILPKGDWINKKGVKPDYEVKNIVKEGNTMTRLDDKQLDKALELLVK